MSERIDHAAKAIRKIAMAPELEQSRAWQLVVESLVHAQLALVEQQRIANLVALWMHDVALIDDSLLDVVGDEIRGALGIRE